MAGKPRPSSRRTPIPGAAPPQRRARGRDSGLPLGAASCAGPVPTPVRHRVGRTDGPRRVRRRSLPAHTLCRAPRRTSEPSRIPGHRAWRSWRHVPRWSISTMMGRRSLLRRLTARAGLGERDSGGGLTGAGAAQLLEAVGSELPQAPPFVALEGGVTAAATAAPAARRRRPRVPGGVQLPGRAPAGVLRRRQGLEQLGGNRIETFALGWHMSNFPGSRRGQPGADVISA